VSSLEWLAGPPASTFFILGVSMFLSFLISSINRLFTSKEKLEQLKAWRKEINTWLSDFNKARRTGDKKLLKKVQKQEKRIKQLQSKVASQSFGQMKILPITIGLFILIWLLLTGTITIPFTPITLKFFTTPFTVSKPVAFLPWFGRTPIPLYLIQWYLICSFAFGFIFSRLFGLMGETE
jgi:uncharacterized membrane protein (DUF106 family)